MVRQSIVVDRLCRVRDEARPLVRVEVVPAPPGEFDFVVGLPVCCVGAAKSTDDSLGDSRTEMVCLPREVPELDRARCRRQVKRTGMRTEILGDELACFEKFARCLMPEACSNAMYAVE